MSKDEKVCARCGTAAKTGWLPIVGGVCCVLILAALVVGAVTKITLRIVKKPELPEVSSQATVPPVVAGVPEGPSPLPNNANDPASCLEFLSTQGSSDQSTSSVSGELKNNCPRSFRRIHIRFKIFDAGHTQVGLASGDVTHVQPGATSRFIARGSVAGRTFELDQVTGL
jgi:hypothetical protein